MNLQLSYFNWSNPYIANSACLEMPTSQKCSFMMSQMRAHVILILAILQSATSTTLLNKNIRWLLISTRERSHRASMKSTMELESKCTLIWNNLSIIWGSTDANNLSTLIDSSFVRGYCVWLCWSKKSTSFFTLLVRECNLSNALTNSSTTLQLLRKYWPLIMPNDSNVCIANIYLFVIMTGLFIWQNLFRNWTKVSFSYSISKRPRRRIH